MQYRSDDSIPLPLREAREALDVYLKDEDAQARVVRAAARALRVRRDSLVARELVADVVGDMFGGELAWDSSTPRTAWALAMAFHLIGELRRRVKRSDYATRNLVPLASLEDEEVPTVHDAEAEADARTEARMDRFERGLAVLRERMNHDAPVTELLGLYASGLSRKSAAVHAGMSLREHHNVRRRLVRAAPAIDRELRDREIAGAVVTPIQSRYLGPRRGVLYARVSGVADVAAEPVRVAASGGTTVNLAARPGGSRAE